MSDRSVDGESPVRFAEPGARIRTVYYGPALCVLVGIVELATGGPVHWFALSFFAIVLAGIVYLQVVAGRRHVSVELTDSELREGTETLPLHRIAEILPAADPESSEYEPWETARTLGELATVPRRRHAIGLRLVDGKLARAWAKDDDGLRAALTEAWNRNRGDAE